MVQCRYTFADLTKYCYLIVTCLLHTLGKSANEVIQYNCTVNLGNKCKNSLKLKPILTTIKLSFRQP